MISCKIAISLLAIFTLLLISLGVFSLYIEFNTDHGIDNTDSIQTLLAVSSIVSILLSIGIGAYCGYHDRKK